MKRTERHHLKDNDLVQLAAAAREAVDTRRNQVTTVAAVVIAILVVGIGVWAWRTRVATRSSQLLSEALITTETPVGPPPAPGAPPSGPRFSTERERHEAALTKFKAAADQYPSTEAGILARYREAATQMALGNTKEAMAAYQQVVDRAGQSILGQMSRLGLADAQAKSGQYDQAIAAYKSLAEQADTPLPVDGILIQLGRTYLEAGKRADAEQTFNRIVKDFPDSPFTGDAQRELETLKKAPAPVT
jgi:predicted negative regulator of RcsB-dependent stress response